MATSAQHDVTNPGSLVTNPEDLLGSDLTATHDLSSAVDSITGADDTKPLLLNPGSLMTTEQVFILMIKFEFIQEILTINPAPHIHWQFDI